MNTRRYQNPSETTLNGKEVGDISLDRQLIGISLLLLIFSLYPEYLPNWVKTSEITAMDEDGFDKYSHKSSA